MKGALKFVGVALALLVAYLLLWPVPVSPVVWEPTPSTGYSGPHAVNTRLAGLTMLPLAGDIGPEHVVVREEAGQTWIYAAVAAADGQGGRIVRLKPDGSGREIVLDGIGRPLGFDFDAEGQLIVADPMWGQHGAILLVKGRGPGARVEPLTDNLAGEPIRYVDAVVVAGNGRIYFTDASRRFGPKDSGGTFNASVLDILEQRCTGRLLEFDPATRRSRLMLGGLCFANGVALSDDQRHLFVAETGAYRIWKVAVEAHGLDAVAVRAAPPAADGRARVLLDALPGYPDNIMRGDKGRFWVGLTKPRSAFADNHAARPWLRAMALRLPKALWPVPPAYGHVFAFDENGRIRVDLQDPGGSYPEATSVTEHAGKLYVQSLHARTLGVLDALKVGL